MTTWPPGPATLGSAWHRPAEGGDPAMTGLGRRSRWTRCHRSPVTRTECAAGTLPKVSQKVLTVLLHGPSADRAASSAVARSVNLTRSPHGVHGAGMTGAFTKTHWHQRRRRLAMSRNIVTALGSWIYFTATRGAMSIRLRTSVRAATSLTRAGNPRCGHPAVPGCHRRDAGAGTALRPGPSARPADRR